MYHFFILLSVEVFDIGFSFHHQKSIKQAVTELRHFHIFQLYACAWPTRTRYASFLLVNKMCMSTNNSDM